MQLMTLKMCFDNAYSELTGKDVPQFVPRSGVVPYLGTATGSGSSGIGSDAAAGANPSRRQRARVDYPLGVGSGSSATRWAGTLNRSTLCWTYPDVAAQGVVHQGLQGIDAHFRALGHRDKVHYIRRSHCAIVACAGLETG
jgi:hypothetical protein